MKTFFLTTMLLFFAVAAYSQADDNIGKYFEFKENVRLNKCNGVGEATTGSEIINATTQFRIDGTNSGGYVIRILKKGTDVSFNTKYYNSKFSTASNLDPDFNIYFLLPLQLFDTKCQLRLVKNSFTLGIVNLPIKARFGSKNKIDGIYNRDFLLTNDVSLGLVFGYKHKWSRDWGINVLTGFSLSAVQVDSSTTKGYVKSAANASGLTGHVGLLVEDNNFQFGVFTGIDFLTGEVGKQWVYRNKPWLGLAIGYSLFKSKSSKDTQ